MTPDEIRSSRRRSATGSAERVECGVTPGDQTPAPIEEVDMGLAGTEGSRAAASLVFYNSLVSNPEPIVEDQVLRRWNLEIRATQVLTHDQAADSISPKYGKDGHLTNFVHENGGAIETGLYGGLKPMRESNNPSPPEGIETILQFDRRILLGSDLSALDPRIYRAIASVVDAQHVAHEKKEVWNRDIDITRIFAYPKELRQAMKSGEAVEVELLIANRNDWSPDITRYWKTVFTPEERKWQKEIRAALRAGHASPEMMLDLKEFQKAEAMWRIALSYALAQYGKGNDVEAAPLPDDRTLNLAGDPPPLIRPYVNAILAGSREVAGVEPRPRVWLFGKPGLTGVDRPEWDFPPGVTPILVQRDGKLLAAPPKPEWVSEGAQIQRMLQFASGSRTGGNWPSAEEYSHLSPIIPDRIPNIRLSPQVEEPEVGIRVTVDNPNRAVKDLVAAWEKGLRTCVLGHDRYGEKGKFHRFSIGYGGAPQSGHHEGDKPRSHSTNPSVPNEFDRITEAHVRIYLDKGLDPHDGRIVAAVAAVTGATPAPPTFVDRWNSLVPQSRFFVYPNTLTRLASESLGDGTDTMRVGFEVEITVLLKDHWFEIADVWKQVFSDDEISWQRAVRNELRAANADRNTIEAVKNLQVQECCFRVVAAYALKEWIDTNGADFQRPPTFEAEKAVPPEFLRPLIDAFLDGDLEAKDHERRPQPWLRGELGVSGLDFVPRGEMLPAEVIQTILLSRHEAVQQPPVPTWVLQAKALLQSQRYRRARQHSSSE